MWEWRYTRYGLRAHALLGVTLSSADLVMVSVCGMVRPYSDWHGIDNQAEFEMADRMPRCRTCLMIIGEESR